jgi:SAM-dependent methyltransferase
MARLPVRPLVLAALVVALSTATALDLPDGVEVVKAPYVPTPDGVVERMLDIARVGEGDVVYDLGSGDGRIVIAAARRGARAIGIELDEDLVEKSRKNAEAAGVADRVRFEAKDLFDVDLSEATVVTLYLLPEVNLHLRPKLYEELAPGTRVVSHAFDMWDWRADGTEVVEHDARGHTLYHWVMPAQVAGAWRWRGVWRGRRERTFVLNLAQTFQRVRGSLDVDRRDRPLRDVRLEGRALSFTVDGPDGEDLVFEGRLEDGRLKGRLGGTEIDAWRTPPEGEE